MYIILDTDIPFYDNRIPVLSIFSYFRYHDKVLNLQQRINPGSDRHLSELLAAAVIRFEVDFRELVEADPKKQWDSTDLHPFQYKLQEAYELASVTNHEKLAWHNEIMMDFESKKFTPLPINQIRYNNMSLYVDSKSILDVTHDSAIATG